MPERPEHLAQSDKRSLGRIAVVAARFQPEYQFDAMVAGKGEGAALGALEGLGACALSGDSGSGWVGGLFFIVCAPIAAAAGAIIGSEGAAPAEQVESAKATAQRGLEALNLQDTTLAAVQRYGADEGLELARLSQPMGPAGPGEAFSYAEAKELADTVIEISVLNARAETSGGKDLGIALGMKVRVRLLGVRDDKEIDSLLIHAGGDLRTLDEWLADDGKEIKASFERGARFVAEQAIDELLLVYHPNAMSPQPASGESSRVPPFALRAIEPPIRNKLYWGTRQTYGALERFPLASLQPEFRWEAWPRGFDIAPGSGPGHAHDVRYDLRVYGPGGVAYERRGLTQATHRLEQPLAACETYRWTVRARFVLNDSPRVTEWMGAFDTMGGAVAPWWIRRGSGAPPLAAVPRTPLFFYPIVETPGAGGEACPGR